MAKRATALVVEDEDSVQRLLQTIVRRHCDTVDVAGDGQTAIDMVRRRSLRHRGPRSDAPENERVRSIGRNSSIATTTQADRPFRDFACYFGDHFPEDTVVLQKPFELDRLEEVIRALR